MEKIKLRATESFRREEVAIKWEKVAAKKIKAVQSQLLAAQVQVEDL